MKFKISSIPLSLTPIFVSAITAATLFTAPAFAVQEAAQEVAQEAVVEKPAKQKTTPPNTPPNQSKPIARLYLTNGDTLSGLPHAVDGEQHLLFKADSLRQTASFSLDHVLAINFDNWKKRPTAKTVARVQLQPRFRETIGDTLLGELAELSPASIKLNTWYGGEITIKRNMVSSLKIISNTPGNYYGPNNIQEWAITGDDDAWKFSNGSLISQATGSVGKDIGLHEKSHISFDVSWKSAMRFKLQLYSSDVSDKNPNAYYEVNINRSSAYLRTRGKTNKGMRILGGGRFQRMNIQPSDTRAHFDLFVDRVVGNIKIYINGELACMLQSQNPDPENLGKGLSFISEERYPMELSDITVTPWNGTRLPQSKNSPPAAQDKDAEAQPEGEDLAPTDAPPHKIILNNGDEVPGNIGEIKDGRLVVETQYTPIRIPLERIKSFSLGGAGEQPKKYGQDIRAWFHSGGYVTLKLTSFKDKKVAGFSQALGDVSFDLSAFSRIDFHIYDHKANETRKAIRY